MGEVMKYDNQIEFEIEEKKDELKNYDIVKNSKIKNIVIAVMAAILMISVGFNFSNKELVTSKIEEETISLSTYNSTKANLEDVSAQFEELKSENSELKDKINNLEKEQSSLNEQVTTLSNSLSEKEKVIEELNGKIEEKDKSINDLNGQLSSKDKEIESKNNEINSKDSEINNLKNAQSVSKNLNSSGSSSYTYSGENSSNVSNSEVVYITKTGSKYHRDGCRTLKSKIQTTKGSAISQGYEACKVCEP